MRSITYSKIFTSFYSSLPGSRNLRSPKWHGTTWNDTWDVWRAWFYSRRWKVDKKQQCMSRASTGMVTEIEMSLSVAFCRLRCKVSYSESTDSSSRQPNGDKRTKRRTWEARGQTARWPRTSRTPCTCRWHAVTDRIELHKCQDIGGNGAFLDGF